MSDKTEEKEPIESQPRQPIDKLGIFLIIACILLILLKFFDVV